MSRQKKLKQINTEKLNKNKQVKMENYKKQVEIHRMSLINGHDGVEGKKNKTKKQINNFDEKLPSDERQIILQVQPFDSLSRLYVK